MYLTPYRSAITAAIALIVAAQVNCGRVFADDAAAVKEDAESTAAAKAAKKAKQAKAVTCFEVNAPREHIWQTLVDFARYPEIFKRIKSCKITKQEGQLVYTESFLKPQLFLREPCQHTVNDLTGKPEQLKWKLLDGNFKSVTGEWIIKPIKDTDKCQVTYTIEVDPGPFIPQSFAAMMLRVMQKEAVTSLKSKAEEQKETRQPVTSNNG